mgnify:CR=1 FL=1
MSDSILQARGLKKHFKTGGGMMGNAGVIRAVDDVSFDVRRGETYAIVGESGCGKSTLARLLMRLLSPTEGDVIFNGIDVRSLKGRDLTALRRDMQFIFQDPFSSLNPRMTVGKLIGDEPVSALDVSVQAQVINLLGDLRDELGLTLVIIAHDLAVIRHMSDRVAVMYLGQIVEQGTVDTVFQHPRHPYTRALLSAIPVAAYGQRISQTALHGEMPSPANPPSGCRFHTRCPYAQELCASQAPTLRATDCGEDHVAACHFFEEIAVAEPDLGHSETPPRAAGASARFALYQDAMQKRAQSQSSQDQK